MRSLARKLTDTIEGKVALERLLEQPHRDACRAGLSGLSLIYQAFCARPLNQEDLKRNLLLVAVRACVRGDVGPDGWMFYLAHDLGIDLDKALETTKDQGVE